VDVFQKISFFRKHGSLLEKIIVCGIFKNLKVALLRKIICLTGNRSAKVFRILTSMLIKKCNPLPDVIGTVS
jgi:hypothetical protein